VETRARLAGWVCPTQRSGPRSALGLATTMRPASRTAPPCCDEFGECRKFVGLITETIIGKAGADSEVPSRGLRSRQTLTHDGSVSSARADPFERCCGLRRKETGDSAEEVDRGWSGRRGELKAAIHAPPIAGLKIVRSHCNFPVKIHVAGIFPGASHRIGRRQ
jgi:hypothetical protein